MPKCINCDKEFSAKRSDAQLCSARCRQQAKRGGVKLRGKSVAAPEMPTPEEKIKKTPPPTSTFAGSGVLTPKTPICYPTDFNELLRIAKSGPPDVAAFKKHVEAQKLTYNQKTMILSKLLL